MPRIVARPSFHAMFLVGVVGACHGRLHDAPDAPSVEPDAALSTGATQEIVLMAPVKVSTLGAQGSEVVMMNLDGTSSVQLTDNDVQEFLPHFSPDATKVVYTKYTTGSYGQPDSASVVAVVDTTTLVETELTATGKDAYPVWSPDGSRLAFLSTRNRDVGQGGPELWVMNADGTNPQRIGGPVGIDSVDDQVWGDIAWSSDDWILFVVAQGLGSSCFKARLDKIRPDGTSRTKITDGGPNCTPDGMEQSGDADPGFSSDGRTIFSSRGLPRAPGGTPPTGTTERRLYAFSADAWTTDKVEHDLTLASEPDCIEGVPKGSPDGTRVLEFRACFYAASGPSGITLTDTAGSFRTYITDGFGPDWNPRATK